MISTAYAKVIVAGEHSVLRNGHALVVPLKKNKLIAMYKKQDFLSVKCEGANTFVGIEDHWLSFIKQAYSNCSSNKLTGEWGLQINIPIGIGLGFSAALSVVVAKMFANLGYIKEEEVFEFAHGLEKPIHGKSSGCDIAGSMSENAIMYNIGSKSEQLFWCPTLAWSTPCSSSSTIDSIAHVENIGDPAIDISMNKAVVMAYDAWQKQNIDLLGESITLASKCFYDWGLVPEVMDTHIKILKKAGALAVKPTGAGGGGSVLSLWSSKINMEGLNWII